MASMSAAAPPAVMIEFRNVWKSFGDHTVLEDVSFTVETAHTLAIMGRSGVGKSVTLKLIMGFLRADQGTVWVDGVNVAELDEAAMTAMHKKITMVFQSGALFDSMTVEENVAFPLRERLPSPPEAQIESTVNQLLHMLDLTDYRNRYPDSLSTGMKRAVAIARALAARPRVILYDEPTTMVDPIMLHMIGDLIARVKRQVKLTSVVVTHDTRLARQLADRLLLLHDSRVRFFGTAAEMDASTDPVVQEFLRQDELALP